MNQQEPNKLTQRKTPLFMTTRGYAYQIITTERNKVIRREIVYLRTDMDF